MARDLTRTERRLAIIMIVCGTVGLLRPTALFASAWASSAGWREYMGVLADGGFPVFALLGGFHIWRHGFDGRGL